MIQIYKTINGKIREISDYEKNCWIKMTDPTEEEIERISTKYSIDEDYLQAALDRQETSRVEEDDDYGCSLITINAPYLRDEKDELIYETIPIGIIETGICVITVCLEQISELNDFVENKIKNVFTNLKTKFILQIIYHVTASFVYYLRKINKKSSEVEAKLHVSFDNQQLFEMLDLEKSTVFFSTALKSNQLVVDKLERGRVIKLYEDDDELLEDIQVEIEQANTMCSIYSNILSGTMDAFASIISNNLNIVMKILTAITILMAIPTMVSSFYGMNVEGLPYPYFSFIFIFTCCITLFFAYVLYKLNMFH